MPTKTSSLESSDFVEMSGPFLGPRRSISPKIVVLFGPDGSGKSTLAKALTRRLDQKGFKTRLSWMRGTHTLASLFAKLLFKLTFFRGSNNPYYGITIPRNLKRLWQLVEFTSAIPIILLKFFWPSILGSWVVAERYAPDFITWVSLTTNDQTYPERIEAKFLLALSSNADVKVYVTATIDELSKRRKETDPKFANDQLELYESIASAIGAYRLDTTNRNVNETLKEALSLLDLP